MGLVEMVERRDPMILPAITAAFHAACHANGLHELWGLADKHGVLVWEAVRQEGKNFDFMVALIDQPNEWRIEVWAGASDNAARAYSRRIVVDERLQEPIAEDATRVVRDSLPLALAVARQIQPGEPDQLTLTPVVVPAPARRLVRRPRSLAARRSRATGQAPSSPVSPPTRAAS